MPPGENVEASIIGKPSGVKAILGSSYLYGAKPAVSKSPLVPFAFPSVGQSVVALFCNALMSAPHRPVTYPDNLRRFPPVHLARNGFHQHGL
jgi:hypothetical protein